jgi:hypothetical protein
MNAVMILFTLGWYHGCQFSEKIKMPMCVALSTSGGTGGGGEGGGHTFSPKEGIN